jgi:hypothetical protein
MKLKTSAAVDIFLPGRAKDLSAPLYNDRGPEDDKDPSKRVAR